MRKDLGLVAALLLCVAAPRVAAQETPQAEVSAGDSYVHTNQIGSGGCCFAMNGGNGSVAANLNNSLGIVAEIAGYHSGNVNNTGLDLNVVTYLVGPRVSYRRSGRVVPFVEALIGGGHASGSLYSGGGTQNAFALATGGGVDAKLGHHLALRLIQADYLLTRFKNGSNDHQNNLRISAGIVLEFGKR